MSKADDTTTDVDIPEQSWTNPFVPGTPLHELYDKRVRQDRDLIIIIDDANGGRGTGKTVATLQLANGMDQTADGITNDKATLYPEELITAYTDAPRGSGLVLDEAELGASNREAMTNVNKALREIMSMGRVEQKYVVINAPLKEFIDKDLRKLADVWISMERKGFGLVHFFEYQRYAERLLTPKQQTIEFVDIPADDPLRDVYQSLTREKLKNMGSGDDGEQYVSIDDHNEQLEKARQEGRKQIRDEIVAYVYQHPDTDVSQEVLANAAGVSQKTVSNIVRRQQEVSK